MIRLMAAMGLSNLRILRFGVRAPGDPRVKRVAAQQLPALQNENNDGQISGLALSLALSSSTYG